MVTIHIKPAYRDKPLCGSPHGIHAPNAREALRLGELCRRCESGIVSFGNDVVTQDRVDRETQRKARRWNRK